MTRPVFIAPVGYPDPDRPRFCRWLTIGTTRHVTACLASIAADEPILVNAQRPADDELCSACREDLRVREAGGDDLAPYAGELGVRADVAVEPDKPRGPYLETRPDPVTGELLFRRVNPEPTVRAAIELFGSAPATSRTVTPLERPTMDPVEAWDEWWGRVRGDAPRLDEDPDDDSAFDHLDDLREEEA